MSEFLTFLHFWFIFLVSVEEEDTWSSCCDTSLMLTTFTDFRTVLGNRTLLCFLGQRRKNLEWERRKTALDESGEVVEWFVFYIKQSKINRSPFELS